MLSSRTCALLNVVLGLSAVAGAFYIEHVLGQAPCDLCMLQRLVVYAIIFVGMIIVLFKPRRFISRCLQGFNMLFALAGVGLAGRHLYLQSLPEELKPSCGPGWDYLVEHAPFMQILESVIKGSGECAQVQGLFFGFSLPFWTLLLFIAMLILSVLGLRGRSHTAR